MEGDHFYKVRITPELIETLMTRDVHGNLITYSVGEADADGFVDLIFTVHYDDNICNIPTLPGARALVARRPPFPVSSDE